MNDKIKSRSINNLFKAILSLENPEECYEFFEDICTIKEIEAMAQRLEVAKLLQEGRKYSDIEEMTGASSATISRVNRFLRYGADGYKKVLERIEMNIEESGEK
jgi:TrpR-related protein YerC/YecD